MHMADALLSVPVALTLAGASALALAWASRRLAARQDEHTPALTAVLGAFVFALQMVNFSIPGTGASGHLGGGLLLAALLGPAPALLAMTAVLTVQALLFADGGLLALGANIFNLGVLPCLVAYPLVYRPIAGRSPSPRRQALAALVAAIVALQLGALGVVLQTSASGISSLPTVAFAWLMLPVHGAIGVAEGLATAALLVFLQRQAPGLLPGLSAEPLQRPAAPRLWRRRALLATAVTGGVLAWFASPLPDGLEWSMAHAASQQTPGADSPSAVHGQADALQQRLAWMPDYRPREAPPEDEAATWPAPSASTSLAGLVGAAVTLAVLGACVLLLAWQRRRPPP